ncbi:MAG TPA: fibronectin type III domain-containing protein [Frankiaceae bacterium]|nr:fibronectin type III domain-containing protein [Frankiaceae bacterium]
MPIGRTMLPALVALGSVAFAVSASPAYAVDPVAAEPARAELRSLAVTPARVDVGAAPVTVGVAARVVSSYRAGAVTIRLGDATPAVPLALTGGSTADGTWSGVVTIPAATPYGALAAHVAVTDAGGGTTPLTHPGALTVADPVPATPASVAAVVTGAGTLRVEWSAPAPNGGSPVTSYDVTAAAAPDAPATTVVPATVAAAADARSATFSGLSAATRYVFTVAARNAAGTGRTTTTDAVTPVAPVPVPDAPTSLVTVAGNGSFVASWSRPASDGGSPLTGYEVSAVPWGDAPVPAVVTVGPDATTTAVSGIRNGVPYQVSVAALNAAGSSLPAVTGVTATTVPGAPVIGSVTAGDGAAVVRWSAPASNGGTPIVSYAVTASPSGTVVNVPATARSVTVKRLANGTAATFRVVAVNLAGRGPASAARTVVPRAPARLVVSVQPKSPIVYRTESVVVGTLLNAAGAAIPGQRVELRAIVKPATTWRTVAAGTTSSTGRVTLRVALPATSALRLRHVPTTYAAPEVSVRSVAVAPKITAAPNDASIRLGTTVTVTGNIAPAHPAGSAVRLQRYASGEWRTVAYGTMTSTSAYRVSWKPGAAGAWYLRVLKPADADHTTGVSPKWYQRVATATAAQLARDILYDASITLERVHQSGISDLANARQNIVDVSNGYLARRSSYQNAPGGYTGLDLRLLRALKHMGAAGSVTVSEIAGGSHAVGSAHYYGRGLDINYVNGRHVAYGSGYQLAIDACRAYGASRIFHPSYDPYGGHSRHVHCEWS